MEGSDEYRWLEFCDRRRGHLQHGHALIADSPAINAGDATPLPIDALDLDANSNTSEPISIDQQGQARVVAGAVDIGAIENQNPDLLLLAFDATPDHMRGGHVSISLTMANQGDSNYEENVVNIYYTDSPTCNAGLHLISTLPIPDMAFGEEISAVLEIDLNRSVLFTDSVATDLPQTGDNHQSVDVMYLCAIVDPNEQLAETSEDNNQSQGQGIDSDDVTYFPWDTNGDDVVTPQDAASIMNRIGQAVDSDVGLMYFDIDGSDLVDQTDADAAINRLGYLRPLYDFHRPLP